MSESVDNFVRDPLFLTLFLLIGGAFTVICASLNLKWFFKTGEDGPTLLIATIGQKAARLFFIFMGVVMLSWGTVRLIQPPREIPIAFLYDLAKPQGIDLTATDALTQLQAASEIHHLETGGGQWNTFRTILPKDSPNYIDARDAATVGPDFSKGYTLHPIPVNGIKVGGRIVYFDDDYVICDNVLFSKHPLSSAAFVMIICEEKLSDPEDGLTIFFARKGSESFQRLTRF